MRPLELLEPDPPHHVGELLHPRPVKLVDAGAGLVHDQELTRSFEDLAAVEEDGHVHDVGAVVEHVRELVFGELPPAVVEHPGLVTVPGRLAAPPVDDGKVLARPDHQRAHVDDHRQLDGRGAVLRGQSHGQLVETRPGAGGDIQRDPEGSALEGADDRLRPGDQGVGDHAGDVLRTVEFGEIRVGRPVSHRHHLHPAHAGLELIAPRDRAFDVERLDAVVAGARLEGGPAIPRGEELERC